MISNEIDFDGLIKKIRQLPPRVGNNAGRRSLRRGANVIKDAAVSKAKMFDRPETPNPIYKNIEVASAGVRRERRAGGPMVRIGVAGGAKSGRNTVQKNTKKNREAGIAGQEYKLYHWRFLEFGFVHRSGVHVPPQPFMRPAMTEKASAAFAAVVAALPKEIDKDLKKLGIK